MSDTPNQAKGTRARGWPGPVHADVIMKKPTQTSYAVAKHPMGPVQVTISTDSAEMTVYFPQAHALNFAKALTECAMGIVIAGADEMPPNPGVPQ